MWCVVVPVVVGEGENWRRGVRRSGWFEGMVEVDWGMGKRMGLAF